jgi:hypothetical protein
MRRREFIRLIGGGAAAAWPPVARGQHTTVRRVGVGLAETDSAALQRRAALKHRLEVLGWVDGHNLDLAVRWSESKIDKAESQAKELVAWNADVLIQLWHFGRLRRAFQSSFEYKRPEWQRHGIRRLDVIA